MPLEHQFNTHEQVVAYLRDALECVQEAETPEHLEEIAFTKALDLISSKNVTMTSADVTPGVLPAMAIPREKGH